MPMVHWSGGSCMEARKEWKAWDSVGVSSAESDAGDIVEMESIVSIALS